MDIVMEIDIPIFLFVCLRMWVFNRPRGTIIVIAAEVLTDSPNDVTSLGKQLCQCTKFRQKEF